MIVINHNLNMIINMVVYFLKKKKGSFSVCIGCELVFSLCCGNKIPLQLFQTTYAKVRKLYVFAAGQN